MEFFNKIVHGLNSAMNRNPTTVTEHTVIGNTCFQTGGTIIPYKPMVAYRDKTILNTVFNRIAADAAAMDFMHCQLDEDGRFQDEILSGLDECLRLSANIDQTGRAFIQDVVQSMLDEGVVVIVPTEIEDGEIRSLRTARVVEWKPREVVVDCYDDRCGERKEITLPKNKVCVIENPFYSIVNEPNSTVQRLKRKLALLDVTDEKTASGKLDLIITLPYATRSERKHEMAEQRRRNIQDQLKGDNQYGIAYIDGTEHITQLNRSLDNNLLKQVEYWTDLMLSQLGMTQTILDGTADDKTMLNYYNRTIEPIVTAIVEEMRRKFLSKDERANRETIKWFRDPFKLVPVNDIAEIADKFTRNEIMSSNEIRQKIGLKPSNDPKADKLENSNIRQPGETDAQLQNGNQQIPKPEEKKSNEKGES